MLCHYAECRVLFNVKLNVIIMSVLQNVVMPSVIMLNAFKLSVVFKGEDNIRLRKRTTKSHFKIDCVNETKGQSDA